MWARRGIGTALVLTLLLSGCGLFGPDRKELAREAGEKFLTAWQNGNLEAASAATTDAVAAKTGLQEAKDNLRIESAKIRPGELTGCEDEKPCVLSFSATMKLTSLGEWRYEGSVTAVEQGEDWLVRWAPTVIHPKLDATSRLRRVRELPPRASILDRNGRELTRERPVVNVGVVPSRLTDANATYAALAELLDIDAAKLADRVKKALPEHFVDVITLRQDAYDDVASRLDQLAGVVTREDSRTLAETPSFARAVLGSVGPATKETLAKAGPFASSADLVGTSGLQAAYQQQLAGQPGGRIEIVDRRTGVARAAVGTFTAKPGTRLQTTLDHKTQQAAELAVAGAVKPTAIVAIQASTGEILAVANGPETSAGYNRAFIGRYPAGSTFKVITTTALLRDGLKVDDTVACPETITVSGKRFKNYDDLGSMGAVPFRRDFTESCNTAFIGRAGKLANNALHDAAASYGLGGQWQLGLGAFSGSVPVADGPVEKAANAIGQGKVLVSPLAMAVVAAAVSSGEAHQPTLVPSAATTATDPASPAATAPADGSTLAPGPWRVLPGRPLAEAPTLRALMLQTVRSGTADVLRMSGTPVGAKTGTAEYGGDSPPKTHGWMIGFRGDLAFAVLVEDGESGAKAAGPVARAFLQAAGGTPTR